MQPLAVILYGSPGSGKSTQAALLADTLGLHLVDPGRLLERIVMDPRAATKPRLLVERANFKAGRLMTPAFVVRQLRAEFRRLARLRTSIILSGNPRTLEEARTLLPYLVTLYGRTQIRAFYLDVDEKTATRRNTNRKVCRVCGRPLLTQYVAYRRIRHCPVCGGELYRRALDSPRVIPVRFTEFREHTLPAIAFHRSLKLPLRTVDAATSPARIFSRIYADLQKYQ